ncbi:MAG: VOC family protein [Alphaproteobacteria bacterium]
MTIHLRQICLVAEKLKPVIDDLTAVLGVQPCYVDPAVKMFGLENTLLAIGTNFLEVVAPIQPDTAAGRYLERRKGDGGYMVICQAKDRAAQNRVRENASAHGVRVAFEHEEPDHNIMQLHPGDMRAAFLEVDWDEAEDPQGKWEPANGLQWQDKVVSEVTSELIGAVLQGPDPSALARHWADVLGIPHGVAGGAPTIPLANGTLQFVPDEDGRGPGLKGLVLKVVDRDRIITQATARGLYVSKDEIEMCGTRFYLRD